ncbi:MAG: hypothetical protein ACKVZH_20350 [Blastocatellia bacterium]
MENLCFIVLLVFLQASSQFADSTWSKVVPLRSTRLDVERILGKNTASPGHPFVSEHETSDGRISVLYNCCPCHSKGEGEWNVTQETVVAVIVTPKLKLKIDNLSIKKDDYIIESSHVSGVYTYTNKNEGITIETNNGNVISLTYAPKAKEHSLRCSSIVKK